MSAPNSDRAILIIDDGGPAALAACLLCEAPASSALWFPGGESKDSEGSGGRRARLEAVRRHAELLGFPAPIVATGGARRGPLATPLMLIEAVVEAGRRGRSRVVWPEHLGDDLDAMDIAANQAAMVSHLARLERSGSGPPPASVETPFIDLPDSRFFDLARDLDLPVDACWWCEQEGPTPCAGCSACRRWRPLLDIGTLTATPAVFSTREGPN